MQRFFETTLVSTYIKYLLSATPLPMYPTIRADEDMIEGVTYIYKHHILKCTKSGRFIGIKGDRHTQDYLYISDTLYATDDDHVMEHYDVEKKQWSINTKDEKGEGGLTVTDEIVRTRYANLCDFKVVGRYTFGKSCKNVTRTFNSNVSYYDSDTHRVLGDYLRCLRDVQGLDLMGMYNCFNYQLANNLSFYVNESEKRVNTNESSKNKTIIVPVKFNKTYTIAIDCSFPVIVAPILYDGKNLIKDSEGKSLTNKIIHLATKFNSLQFISPQKIFIDNTVDYYMNNTEENSTSLKDANKKAAQLMEYEKYLYLAIQLPATNDSSIVVLEGDFTSISDNYVSSAHGISSLSDTKLSKLFRSKLSLLHSNDTTQKPFADKLISYLLYYTIDTREYIDENVRKVEKAIEYNPPLDNFYSGMWDDDLRYAIYKTYMMLPDAEWISKEDILGFVDSDVENAINRNMMHLNSASERGLKPYVG